MTNTMQIQTNDQGYTPEEVAHAQRIEQMGIIHQELEWLTEQPMTQQARGLIGLLWDRISFVESHAEANEIRAIQWQKIASDAVASASDLERQRDAVLDELSDYIHAVQAGQHPDVKELIEKAEMKAFEEYHENAGRLISLAEKIRDAEKKGA